MLEREPELLAFQLSAEAHGRRAADWWLRWFPKYGGFTRLLPSDDERAVAEKFLVGVFNAYKREAEKGGPCK